MTAAHCPTFLLVLTVRSASGLRVEHNRLPHRSTLHHVTLLISFPFLLSLSLSPRVRRQHVLKPRHKTNELRVPITVFSALTALLLLLSFPFILHLWSRSLEQRLPTLSHYYAASVCSLIHPHLSFPLYAYILYSILITCTPEIASTIQIL